MTGGGEPSSKSVPGSVALALDGAAGEAADELFFQREEQDRRRHDGELVRPDTTLEGLSQLKPVFSTTGSVSLSCDCRKMLGPKKAFHWPRNVSRQKAALIGRTSGRARER